MSGSGYQLRGPASGAPSGGAFGPVCLPPGVSASRRGLRKEFTAGSAPDRQKRPGLLWDASNRFQGQSESVCGLAPGGAASKHRGALRPASSRGATVRSMSAATGPGVSAHRQGTTGTTSMSTGRARIRSPDGSPAESPVSPTAWAVRSKVPFVLDDYGRQCRLRSRSEGTGSHSVLMLPWGGCRGGRFQASGCAASTLN